MAEQRFGKLSDEDLKHIEQIIIPVFKEKLNALNDNSEIKRLSENYEASVKEIASINPFLAFRLAGQSERLNTIKIMEDYFKSAQNLIPSEDGQMLLKNVADNYSSEKLIKEMTTDIKDSIIAVSKEIGIYKKMQSLGYLTRQENINNAFAKKEIAKIIEQIETQIRVKKDLDLKK